MPPGQGLSDPIATYQFLASLGMNNRSNELDFNGEFVLLAQNARFAQMPQSVIKRQPLAYYNETTMSTTQGMVGTYRYYSVYGPQLIAVCGSTVYVGNDSTGVMTPIRTLSNANRRMTFVTYDSLMIGSNGYDEPFVFDGGPSNVTWALGSCQALVTAGTGITATAVSYAITIDDNAYICGAVSNTIASLTNQAVGLTYIPLGPEGTVDRQVYRKDSGTSGNYKHVATISDNSTTTYTDTTPSGSLGSNMPTVTDPMPVGAWILIFAERLFITADPNNPNYVYYSNPYLPGYIQVDTNLDYLPVSQDDGDQIQGLAVQTGRMYCIKQNNIRPLNISTAESNVDPSTWSAEDITCSSGTPARYSICQTPQGIVFLNWDAWYIFDGGSTAKPFIPQFDPTQILPANYDNVVTCYNDGMLYASYTSIASGVQYPTQVMVYDMKLNQFGVDTYSAGCFASATGVNEAGELYIGDATQGFVYKAEEGDVFSSLSSLTQAQAGTTAGTFVGGTQNTAFIQIGAPNAPLSIPNGVCLLWDDTTSTPGTGWTEITAYPYTYPVVSLTSGLTGGTSLHTHTITGTTSTNTGPTANSGNGNPRAAGSPHNHTYSGNTDAMFANPNYFGLRIFYKNNLTTEYQFPVGSILMWDQQGSPDGWIPYAQSNNGYLNLVSPVASAPNWTVNVSYTVGQYVTASDPFSGQLTIYYCQIAHTSGIYDNQFNYAYGFNAGGSPNVPSSGAGGTGQYPVTVGFSDDLAAGFWVAQYDNLGITISPSHSHPYGVVNLLVSSGPNPPGNNNSDAGNLGGLNDHQHYALGVTNATYTGGYWDLDRLEINFIKKLVTGETPWDGTSKNIVALFWDTGAPATPTNGWSEIGATSQAYSSVVSYSAGNMVTFNGSYYQCLQTALNQEPDTSPTYWQGGPYGISTIYSVGQYASYNGINYQCIQAATGQEPDVSPAYWQVVIIYLKSVQNYITPQSNNGYTHSHGNTPAITTSYPLEYWDNAGYEASTGQMHQHILTLATNTIAINNPAWVSFRLWSTLLGKMVSWNNAVSTTYTNGLYYSPALQLNVATFGELFYNASNLPTDSVNFYFQTGPTAASLTSGLVPTWTGSVFTLASHGLANGNRVSITATSMPTGLLGTIIYYVVNVTTNTFQVSLTLAGSPVTFSGGSGVTVFPWSDEISNSDTIIAATPNVWVSYVVEFIAGDTTVSNPTLTTENGYILQFSYSRAGTTAETSVEFIYTTGRMNAGEPMVDKIYKRIASDHTGSSGQVQVNWETENASNSLVFDLSAFPSKWASFFQDMAMGETLNITYYKNDLYDFNLRGFKVQFTPQPLLI